MICRTDGNPDYTPGTSRIKNLYICILIACSLLVARASAQANDDLVDILLGSSESYIPVSNDDTIYLSFPGSGWALQIFQDGLKRAWFYYNPEADSLSWEASSSEQGIALTVYFGPADDGLTAVRIRDSLMAEMRGKGYQLADLEVFESGDFVYADYFGDSQTPDNGYYRDTWAFTVIDDVWIHAHLSGNRYHSSKAGAWERYLSGIQIVRDYSPDSWANLEYGTHYWIKEQFDSAAKYYGNALELEKRQRSLSDTFYIYIIDQYGMSLGIGGEHEKALRIFRFGLEEIPNYPSFYYNIACAHAEMGNIDSVLTNLEKFYDYRGNFYGWEQSPDPFEDESFRSLWRKKKFRDLVNRRHEFE